MIAEIIGPSGRVHYRRPVGDPLIEQAAATPGYSVRYVEAETVEPPAVHGNDPDPMHPPVERSECKLCGAEIFVAELCDLCADGNDPFPATSKHRAER